MRRTREARYTSTYTWADVLLALIGLAWLLLWQGGG